MAGLDADEAAIAAEAFRFLVTPSRTKIAQRTSDLAWWSGRSEAEVGAVLERLASGRRGRLLRPLPPHPGERSVRYEIFHDVLGEAILDWRKRHEQEQETKELASRLEREKGERLEEERLRHQAQVNRLLRRSAAALVALVLLLAVATAVALRQRGEADAERRVAESQALALSAVAQLESDPELSVLLGRQAWETDRNRNAEQALRRAVSASRVRGRLPVRGRGLQTDADPSGRVLALAERDRVRLWDVRRRRWMAGAPLAPGGAVEWVLWSDDGRTVAVAGKERVLVRRLGETVTRSVGAGGPMADVALSADGRHVATARGRTVTVRSIAGGGTERTLRHPWPVADVEFDPSGGRRLATATCDDGNVRVWSWARGTARILRTDGTRSTHPPSAPSEAACVAAYSPDGRQLATAVRTDEPRVWDARTGRRVSEEDLLFVDEQVEALGWDPTGSTMVILARNLLYVAEPDGFPTEVVAPGAGSARSDTGVQATGGVHAGDDVFRVATFSRDGRHLAAGTGGGAIVVVDAVTGRRELTLRGHGEGIGDVAFLEGDQLASASADGTARVWDAEVPRYVRAEEPDPRSAGDGVAPFEPPAAPDGPELDDPSATFGNLPDDLSALSGAAYSPDGERVAIADLAGRVRVVDLDDGRLVQVRTRMRAARSVRFADDGRLVVAAGGTPGRHVGGVTVADARTGRVVHRLRFDAEVVSAELSPDRRAVLAVTADGGALERRLRGGAPRRLSWPDGSTVNSARFSPDGRRVLAAGGDGILRIFDARSHELLEQFELRSGGSLYGSAFSPDGRRVVAYGSARHARVLDARTGREIATLRGHEGPVMSAAFSTDGRLIVTGSTDRTVRVWGATTGLVHAVEEIHSGAVNSVAFAPATPTAILTAGNDGSARILRCRSCGPMDEVLALADAGRTRTLTPAERRDFLP